MPISHYDVALVNTGFDDGFGSEQSRNFDSGRSRNVVPHNEYERALLANLHR